MKNLVVFIIICAIGITSYSASGQSISLFRAKLVDHQTKNPVTDARIILALKTKDKPECVINIKLSAVSKENGEVLIPDVPAGEYVVFYNTSGALNSELANKVIGYDPASYGHGTGYKDNIAKSFGCQYTFMPGSEWRIIDGNLVIDGYFYVDKYDLGLISKDGKLFQVKMPIVKGEELTIEINTAIGKSNL